MSVDDEVFKALGDPSRRALLDRLNQDNGRTLRELCDGLDMARQSVSKHLAILEAANLVTTVRRGREKLHYLNAAPIGDIADRWISRYDRPRADALAGLKQALEATPMSRPEFVYTSYVRTTPEQLWRGLTDPEFTQRYWGVALESAWTTGARVTHVLAKDGTVIDDPEQVVLAAEPFTRLSYTWHTFTAAWAAAYDIDEPVRAAFAAEPRSRVTFTIEDLGDHCRLTVVHDGFGEDSAVLAAVRGGWPQIIAGLKTLLETGSPLTAV